MKKPSERIDEIMEENLKYASEGWIKDKIGAIIDYLDEQHEQNKLCEHQWDTAGECNLCGKFYK